MAEDLYKTLGVAKDASADDIRKAYRKLAKKHHPDLNPGDKKAEELFKTISVANELLSDPDKRARYDRGEIDSSGAEKAPPRSYRHYADTGNGERYAYTASPGGAGAGFANEGFEDLFSTIFAGGGPRGGTQPARGADAQYALTVDFLEAIKGGNRRLTLPDGQTLDVKIPPGTAEGDTLRLRGRGAPGRNSGLAGDALIELGIAPHAFYVRDGQDIRYELPVTIKEALLGAKTTIPTPTGNVVMTIKPRSESGTELRLRGRGVPAHGKREAGDLYVKLRVVIAGADDKLEAFLADWEPESPTDPRRHMTGDAD